MFAHAYLGSVCRKKWSASIHGATLLINDGRNIAFIPTHRTKSKRKKHVNLLLIENRYDVDQNLTLLPYCLIMFVLKTYFGSYFNR